MANDLGDLEQRRERFSNLLGSGTELDKTGLKALDDALAALTKEKGKAWTTLCLIVFRSKKDLRDQTLAGATDKELEESSHIQSMMIVQLASHLEFDIDLVMNDVAVLQKLGVEAIKAEKEAGDPNGLIENLSAIAAAR